MIERTIRIVDGFEAADEATRADDNELTPPQRFAAFMKLMEPYYAASNGFQRVYRVDDFESRSVCDDWRLRLQPISEPKSDG